MPSRSRPRSRPRRSRAAPAPPPARGRAAVARAVAALIGSLGLDPAAEPELRDTPARVADLYAEVFSGLDPGSEPGIATFPHARGAGSPGDDVVVLRDLPFYSLCVHHFVPFFGRAHIAYLPGDRIIGISGGARLLALYARRPQLQERITTQIADHLERLLRPRGVAVVLEARHLCMEMRGVRTPGRIETRVVRGALAEPLWASVLGEARGPASAEDGLE